jgi:hypothetical protein
MYDKIMTEEMNPKKIEEPALGLLRQVRTRTVISLITITLCSLRA